MRELEAGWTRQEEEQMVKRGRTRRRKDEVEEGIPEVTVR